MVPLGLELLGVGEEVWVVGLDRLPAVGRVAGAADARRALEAGANAMQRDAGVPSVVVSVVEALLILLVLAADRWRPSRADETGT